MAKTWLEWFFSFFLVKARLSASRIRILPQSCACTVRTVPWSMYILTGCGTVYSVRQILYDLAKCDLSLHRH